uniref:DUF11 domain-containing protein n=1 Tax=Algoriphagus sp. TaxID=1872435 RepID=UPI0040486445
MKKITFFLLTLVTALQSYGQYSDLHYFPPLSQENSALLYQKIYITTAVTDPFTVTVYRGTSTTAFATLTISKTNPGFITSANGLSDGDNNITLMDNDNIGNVLSDAGLRFESSGGQKFYVNYRGISTYQGTSITSKGRAALGTAFKWGGAPNRGLSYSNLSNSMGIMATEDNTVVEIFGYNPSCTFKQGTNADAITADNISITLNKGQSYVLKSVITAANSPNVAGWIGASVTATKPIAMSVGQLHLATANHVNQDAGADQIIPENTLGRDYVFVRGSGQDEYEFAIIVATQNGTKIFVNGSATEIATINNGQYFVVPGSYYSTSAPVSYVDDGSPGSNSAPGGNMYVRTSKEVYAYQALAGANKPATVDLNFVAPVNCLLSSKVDYISNITEIATGTLSGGINLIASTTIPEDSIDVRQNGTRVSTAALLAAKKTVAGTTDWKTYYLTGLTGDVSVSASGPIAVGFILQSGSIGASGYFSGFETIPTINVNVSGDGCLPGSTLVATPGFPSYAWYRNGVVIPGQTNNTYEPDIAGDYYVIVSNGLCDYQSASQSLYDCNPEVITAITANKNTVNSGETITFSITAGYLGYSNLTNLVVRNQIPANLTVNSATPSYGTWTGSGNDFNWNIGTMYPSEEHRLTVVATVKPLSTNVTQTYTLTNTQTQTDANKVVDDPTENILFLARQIPTQSNFPDYTKQIGQANFNLSAPTSSSSGAFTYSSSDTSVVTMNGSQVILVGQGSATITATQAETASWAEKSITAIITVLPKNGLINTGKLATTSALVVNKNGARGFGVGQNQYGGRVISLNTPTVHTKVITSLTSTTASSGGFVVSNGGKDVTARGVCWRRLPGATIEHNSTSESGTIGEFTSSITGLSPNTTYYLRAYSTNKLGTSYGNEISFTTSN